MAEIDQVLQKYKEPSHSRRETSTSPIRHAQEQMSAQRLPFTRPQSPADDEEGLIDILVDNSADGHEDQSSSSNLTEKAQQQRVLTVDNVRNVECML